MRNIKIKDAVTSIKLNKNIRARIYEIKAKYMLKYHKDITMQDIITFLISETFNRMTDDEIIEKLEMIK